MIHITHNSRILCHLQNGGMVFTVDFMQAGSVRTSELCPDCLRRWENINRMYGPPHKNTRIGTVEKRAILETMQNTNPQVHIINN